MRRRSGSGPGSPPKGQGESRVWAAVFKQIITMPGSAGTVSGAAASKPAHSDRARFPAVCSTSILFRETPRRGSGVHTGAMSRVRVRPSNTDRKAAGFNREEKGIDMAGRLANGRRLGTTASGS